MQASRKVLGKNTFLHEKYKSFKWKNKYYFPMASTTTVTMLSTTICGIYDREGLPPCRFPFSTTETIGIVGSRLYIYFLLLHDSVFKKVICQCFIIRRCSNLFTRKPPVSSVANFLTVRERFSRIYGCIDNLKQWRMDPRWCTCAHIVVVWPHSS